MVQIVFTILEGESNSKNAPHQLAPIGGVKTRIQTQQLNCGLKPW